MDNVNLMWFSQCKWNNNKQMCVMSASQLWYESVFPSVSLVEVNFTKVVWSVKRLIYSCKGEESSERELDPLPLRFWNRSQYCHHAQRICLSTNCKQQAVTRGTLSVRVANMLAESHAYLDIQQWQNNINIHLKSWFWSPDECESKASSPFCSVFGFLNELDESPNVTLCSTVFSYEIEIKTFPEPSLLMDKMSEKPKEDTVPTKMNAAVAVLIFNFFTCVTH